MKKLVAIIRAEFEQQITSSFLTHLERDGWDLSLGQRIVVFKQEDDDYGNGE